MKTELVFLSAIAASRPLTSVCPHNGIAKPSVWSRRRGVKVRSFNDFHCDYPLHLSSFWPEYCSVPRNLYTRPLLLLLMLPSESFSSRAVCRFRFQRLSHVVGCSSNNSASTSLIGKAAARIAPFRASRRALPGSTSLVDCCCAAPALTLSLKSSIQNSPLEDVVNLTAVAAIGCRAFVLPR